MADEEKILPKVPEEEEGEPPKPEVLAVVAVAEVTEEINPVPIIATVVKKEKKNDAKEIAEKIQAMKLAVQANTPAPEVFDCAHKKEIKNIYAPVFANIRCVIVSLEGTLFSIDCDTVNPTPDAVSAFQK